MQHPATPEHQKLLAETIANHFPQAVIDGDTVALGVAGLHIACKVEGFNDMDAFCSAHLFFNVWGGALGPEPVFTSVSGYSEQREAAIISGACNWACSFGPVLRAALAQEELPDVDRFEVTLDGRPWRVFLDGLDRALMFGGAQGTAMERWQDARKRLGATPWLAKPVLDSGTLPLLGGDTPVLLGVFVSDSLESRTVEVKVHGQDWPQSQDVFKDVPAEPDGAITMLRELAVLVPQGPALPLSRATLERTFQGLTQAHRSTPRPMLAWPGWRAHQGALLSPMPEADVHAMESELGPLPPDYRRFLVEVAAGGAGPGYGLLAPMGQGQQRLARGQFTWRDSEEPRTPPEGCVALAYAGCGVMWLLVISGPNRGEVWVDAVGSDRVARRVARSFDAFYRAWLDAALRNSTTFAQWNALRCATPNVLTHVLDDLEGQGIRGDAAMRELARKVTPQSLLLRSAPTPYFYDQELMGPCLPCVLLVERLGLSQDVFVDGIPPLQGRPLPPPPEGMLARWARKLGKREA